MLFPWYISNTWYVHTTIASTTYCFKCVTWPFTLPKTATMLPPLPLLAIYILDAYAKNNKYSYSSSYTITISCVLSQAGIPCLPLPVQNIHRTPSILSTTTIGCILLRAGVPCLPISVSNHFLHYELPFLFLHLLPLLLFQEYLLCYQLSLYSHT